eukprot:1324457-Ditylum_brightwellii.AAC.1
MAKMAAAEFANPYVDGKYFVMKSIKRCSVEVYDLMQSKKEDVTVVADNLTTLLLLVDSIAPNQAHLDSNL